MSHALKELLSRHVAAGSVPGAVAAILARGDDLQPVAVGVAAPGGPEFRADAIVRIQSMTKAVTSVAALRLVERGRIGLDDAVDPWLPELADPAVLSHPDASLDDTRPSPRPITLRHLLTNTSGYGMMTTDSPLAREMVATGVEAGPVPSGLDAAEWLARAAALPLAFAPGEGWRYHHSFGILGVLLSRVTGRATPEHLRDDLFEPLGMRDTGFWAPTESAHRLPATFRRNEGRLVEGEPAGGGFYAGPPAHDVSHEELVSTLADYVTFLRALTGQITADSEPLLTTASVTAMTSDQVPDALKRPDSFFPGFWDHMGWGFGVGVHTAGDHVGRFGWSGGLGTDFFVDPDGTIGVLLTQVDLDDAVMGLFHDFQQLDPHRSRDETEG
ncbi:serine hydrolase domain-containing protein [Microbacterium sp. SSW1-59]|uniref:serine hydrolase domain-containing protein n=1 Tax=Microbacterium xanthum TaxID=3079794 RepID=UPI002AD37147|nr:serine hydrolase domain-containing protein [Microbacterium sp. SSW1-59]MDZ8200768.1 serine hydrolase domain-containing protein [Microbacterium sp. SSW1-59]